jgi:hypothetical protein
MRTPFSGTAGEGGELALGRGLGRAGTLLALAVLAALAVMAVGPAQALARDADDLEKALRPGEQALSRVLPGLEALANTLGNDVGNGTADVHVFYGMVIARLLVEQSRDTISLMRSAQAQACPALEAALAKRLSDDAVNLGGAVEIIVGALPFTGRSETGLLGRAAVEAFRLYLQPLKEFAAKHKGGEL